MVRTILLLRLLQCVALCVAAGAALAQTISARAGTGLGDNDLATRATLFSPERVVLDGSGNLYIADTGSNRVRRISATLGVMTTVAGNGSGTSSGDGGAAAAAGLSADAVAVDSAGNLYVADTTNRRVRKVTAATGVITTIAGNGSASHSGDGGPAAAAGLTPTGLAVDGAGNLYVADASNHRVRKITAATGIITTLAGDGTPGFAGDGGAASAARVSGPRDVAVDSAGNVFVADTGNHRIRRIAAGAGTITTVAGNGTAGFSGDGGAAAAAALDTPFSAAVDGSGNLYIADTYNHRIRRVTASTGAITTVAGNGTSGFAGDGGAATAARLSYPVGVAVDSAGGLRIADWGSYRVRRVSAGTISTIAGVGIGDGGQATSAGVYLPRGLAFDASGHLFYADSYLHRIRRIDAASGVITTIAGLGGDAFCGDGGNALNACFNQPLGIAIDGGGNIFIADYLNHRVRRIAANGTITTIAGTGEAGFAGDGGAATAAKLNRPQAVAVAANGDLYIADTSNFRVRRVAASNGLITTVAGNGSASFSGEGVAATVAGLDWPSGLAVDAGGNLYIADGFSYRVRRVAAGTGIITTVAGNGTPGFSGDGGPATAAHLDYVNGVALDAQGNLYISDSGNNRIRRVQASTGIITTLAGTGAAGASGNGGAASAAGLSVWHAAIDSSGNVHFADYQNAALRRIARDALEPATTIASAPASASSSSIATFRFSGADAGGSTVFQCSLDGAAFTPCAATTTFTGLAAGTHTLQVRAVDAWGNVDTTPAVYTWTVASPLGASALAAGMFYSCAMDQYGAIACWGDNGSGKLGTGESIQSLLPITVGGLASSVTAIGASQNHTCALASDGKVLCWGGNYFGELGNGGFTSSGSPVVVGRLSEAVSAIAVGSRHNCVLTVTGRVHCWGLNRSGQLGSGEASDSENQPVAVPGLVGALAISAGVDHTCAITAAKALVCWGDNTDGQLGDGTTTRRASPTAVVGLPGPVRAVSAGTRHTCAATEAGTLHCWGQNAYGQLGNGTTTRSLAPVSVGLPAPVSSFAAGSWYTCAAAAGALHCWGSNFFAVVGTGTAEGTLHASPTAIAALASGVTGVSAGRTHACALRQDGAVFCWGENDYGAVGDGTSTTRRTPTRVQGLPADITAVAAGNFHSCAVTSTRRARCWGYNADGQLGGGAKIGYATATAVAGFASGVTVKAGLYHTCAINGSGGVSCWGQNFSGQLGNGSEVGSSSPVAVQGLASGMAALAVGGKHTCAASRVGGVLCWGDNSAGQLGAGSGTSRSDVPVEVQYLTEPVVGLSAGWSHTCAVASGGSVYCWGKDTSGALGSAAVTSSERPLRVAGLPADIVAVSGSLYHQCALAASGDIWCWGNNLSGQLGDGTGTNRFTPVKVRGLSDRAVKVSAGLYHTCALTAGGGVECWGYGGQGQLGDGYLDDSAAPIPVPALRSGVIDIAAGTESCALNENGVVYCWGASNFGQVGDGTYAARHRPVTVLARGGGGSLDTNDWYLDLVPTKLKTIEKQFTPGVLTISRLTQAGDGSDLDTTVKYKSAEFGRNVQHFVFARVPPQFFSMVKLAPGAATEAQLRAKSGADLVFAQLTPHGWTNAQGQLLAHSQGVANASGSAANILNGVRLDLIPGARFCVGYGASATDMLSQDSFRDVLVLQGATSAVESRPCVLSGVYLDGPRSSSLGSSVTFIASVVGLSPTGTVQFLDGAAPLLSAAALQDSSNPAVRRASISTASLAAGTHSIGARYSGDSGNAAASAAVLLHEVVLPAATTRVELDGPRDSSSGRAVFFRATVSGNNPAGSVQFRANGGNLGAPIPVVGGVATIRVEGLAPGNYSISANYLGDGANAAGASSVLVHHVYEAVTTRVALASSPNPSAWGAAVTFTVTVTGSNPTGEVVLRSGATVLARATLAAGTASAIVSGLAAGSHFIEADYLGDAGNQAVSSAVWVQQVSPPAQAASLNVFLASSANPSALGDVVTFTATVSGGASPTGTIAFRLGDRTLCSRALSGTSASCATGALAAGVHGITAVYSGDAAHAPAQSSLLSQSVQAAASPLTASPAAIDFGTQGVNTTSVPIAITLTNSAAAAITFGQTRLPQGVRLSTSDCAATLAANASCRMAFAFRPEFAGAIAGSIVIGHGGGATAIAVAGTGERSLVGHYYRAILGRAPDAGGRAFWEAEAARVASLGANVNETWFAMAMSFFNSGEYVAFGRNTAGYVADLYSTFFNRSADDAGLAYWTGQIASGMPREVVLVSFMFSAEFVQFAQAIFGNTAARAEVDTVVDFYRGLLARLPDSAGFNFWVGQFRTAQCQGANAVYAQVEAISSGYANSAEYAARNRSNAQYVGDLYNAFLRRGGDLDGVRFWIGQLDSGARTRDQLRRDFVASAEFSARVAAIVGQGCRQ